MTETQSLISDFDWLANVYTRHGAINHPSELHGMMIGEIAGGTQKNPDDWIETVVEHIGVEELNTHSQTRLVQDLVDFYQGTAQLMEQDSSAFMLFLPDDEYDLPDRIESLTVWVQGFLEGLAMALGEELKKVGSDLQEIMRDFVDICQLDIRVGSVESEEKDFFEVCEFVRIGVLNIYSEFHQPNNDPEDEAATEGHTLH